MSIYSAFARFYDRLTFNVDYNGLADYFSKMFEHFGAEPSLVLDLACGTGSLAIELAGKGYDVIGVDASSEMLSVARQKADAAGRDVLFLNQKMQELDLFGTVDCVVCSLDSINHMTSVEDVQATFERISLFLNKGGLFVFDVNTVYKHRKVLSGATFVYDLPEVYCVWINEPVTKDNVVKMHLDFFVASGNGYIRYGDEVVERAYSVEEISGMLENAGLEVAGVFEYLTMDKPRGNAVKIVFVTKKM